MSPASNMLLSFILIALGFLGIILSFIVADKKKSLISLGLAAVIIVVGLFQWSSQALSRNQINKRMRDLQKQSQVDLDALRQKLREQTQPTPARP